MKLRVLLEIKLLLVPLNSCPLFSTLDGSGSPFWFHRGCRFVPTSGRGNGISLRFPFDARRGMVRLYSLHSVTKSTICKICLSPKQILRLEKWKNSILVQVKCIAMNSLGVRTRDGGWIGIYYVTKFVLQRSEPKRKRECETASNLMMRPPGLARYRANSWESFLTNACKQSGQHSDRNFHFPPSFFSHLPARVT